MRRCRVAPAVCSTPIHIACEGESVAPALHDLLHEVPHLIILIEGTLTIAARSGHNEQDCGCNIRLVSKSCEFPVSVA
jgi:hypothetical protein